MTGLKTGQNWAQFVEDEREKLARSAQDLQQIMNQSPVPMHVLQELAKLDLTQLDPDLAQKLAATGAKEVPRQPEKNASTYRQKRHVWSV